MPGQMAVESELLHGGLLTTPSILVLASLYPSTGVRVCLEKYREIHIRTPTKSPLRPGDRAWWAHIHKHITHTVIHRYDAHVNTVSDEPSFSVVRTDTIRGLPAVLLPQTHRPSRTRTQQGCLSHCSHASQMGQDPRGRDETVC